MQSRCRVGYKAGLSDVWVTERLSEYKDTIGSNEKDADRCTMLTLIKRKPEQLYSFPTKWISERGVVPGVTGVWC